VTPRLLALDFDGVVCDGMDEFFESSRRALVDVTGREVPKGLRDRFAALRPIVESGWEMVVLVGALSERPAAADAELGDSRRWAAARDAYLGQHGLDRPGLTIALDAVRERWLAQDRGGWLEQHRFYPGVASWMTRLAADGQLLYVLSTKGKPFLDALLAWQGVRLPPERVIGKAEPKREKWEVLRELAASHGVAAGDLWFVEDRLPTLLDFRHDADDFAARLFLADWGYIFPDRDPGAARAAGLPVLSLAQMTGPFERWPAGDPLPPRPEPPRK
jgi:phosphoglycolate phosphatase-like HAD superfamily hydrolase